MKRVGLTMALVAAALLPGAGSALAANENASCPGIGISDHASNLKDWQAELQGAKEFLAANGLSVGDFMSRFAKVHAETHVPGCEDAANEILGELVGP